MSDSYADIIDHPYPFPCAYPRMPMSKRAAQFAPFKAMTGYEESVAAEVARHTADMEHHETNEEWYD
ncbi:MAG: hypothetical protein IJT34_02290 [Butyrivibrio sp.]|nr:hypothetical protein [Butyrivibrio sp.]